QLVVAPKGSGEPPLRSLVPSLGGNITMIDPGVESEALDSGKWLSAVTESRLVTLALADGAEAAIFPYGTYRLTRTSVDAAESAATWPLDTEVQVRGGGQLEVCAPHGGRVLSAGSGTVVLDISSVWHLIIRGISSSVTP